jgi:hypothetical protein
MPIGLSKDQNWIGYQSEPIDLGDSRVIAVLLGANLHHLLSALRGTSNCARKMREKRRFKLSYVRVP